MHLKTRNLAHAALIAALYATLAHLQNFILPGSGSFGIQCRLAEALCVLALFSPAAVSGLGIGCLIFNITFAAALPLDFLVGTAATCSAAFAMYALRNIRIHGYPLPAMLMPALTNGILVGWELTVCVGGALYLNALYVALGELIVMLTLGSFLLRTLQKRGIPKRLFRED